MGRRVSFGNYKESNPKPSISDSPLMRKPPAPSDRSEQFVSVASFRKRAWSPFFATMRRFHGVPRRWVRSGKSFCRGSGRPGSRVVGFDWGDPISGGRPSYFAQSLISIIIGFVRGIRFCLEGPHRVPSGSFCQKLASFGETSSRDETWDLECGVGFVLSKSKDGGAPLTSGERRVWLFQNAMPVAIRSHGDFASGSKFGRK